MSAGDELLDTSGNVKLDASGNRMLDDGAGNTCPCGCGSGIPCPNPCAVNPAIGYGCPVCWDAANARVCTPKFIRITFAGVTGGICVPITTGGSAKAPATINAAYVCTYFETSGSCRWTYTESAATSITVLRWLLGNTTCSGSPFFTNEGVAIDAQINGSPGAYTFNVQLTDSGSFGMVIFAGHTTFTEKDCVTTLTISNNGLSGGGTANGGTGGTATVEFCV